MKKLILLLSVIFACQGIASAQRNFNRDVNFKKAVNASETFTASSNTVLNETGGDHDIRMESDGNDSMLFIDASANAVGIGTNAPAGTLHVFEGDDTVNLTIENDTQIYILQVADIGTGDDRLTFRDGTLGQTRGKLNTAGTWEFGTTTPSSFTATGILNMGNAAGFFNRTLAQIQGLTPTAQGQTYMCTDCATAALCTSTGTAAAQFSEAGDRTADCN